MAVRRELHAIRKTGRQIFDELARRNRVTLPDQPARDELRFGIDVDRIDAVLCLELAEPAQGR